MDKIKIFVISRNNEDLNILLSAINDHNDLQIIGFEEDEADTIIKTERLKPDVLIMDLRPPGIDGTELAPIILRRTPATAIIMMSDRDENDYAYTALRTGIYGFLLRKTDMDKLLPAVKIVNSGGYYISSSIMFRALDSISMMRQLPGQFYDNKNKCPFFSYKERMIIEQIAMGFTDEQIARHFQFSTGTITNYVSAIKRKTKLKNRTQIAIYSLVYGLIDLDQVWQHIDI